MVRPVLATARADLGTVPPFSDFGVATTVLWWPMDGPISPPFQISASIIFCSERPQPPSKPLDPPLNGVMSLR
jgi:hypothetical protein